MRKFYLILSLLCFPFMIFAAKFVTVNGIKYQYSKKGTYLIVAKAAYSGDIVIPANVKIPNTDKELPVKKINGSAFASNGSITSVTLPITVDEIPDYAFENCSELKKIVMGDFVTKIGHWAFRNCEKLEDLILPKELKEIGNYCFDRNFNLTKIVIPEKVSLIGGWVFEGNPQIKTIVSMAQVPPKIRKGSIDGTPIYTIFDDENYGDRVLFVPKGKIEDYKNVPGWNHFNDIREIVPESVQEVKYKSNDISIIPEGDRSLVVTASIDMDVLIFDINGQLIRKGHTVDGVYRAEDLPKGIVIVNGQRFIVK